MASQGGGLAVSTAAPSTGASSTAASPGVQGVPAVRRRSPGRTSPCGTCRSPPWHSPWPAGVQRDDGGSIGIHSAPSRRSQPGAPPAQLVGGQPAGSPAARRAPTVALPRPPVPPAAPALPQNRLHCLPPTHTHRCTGWGKTARTGSRRWGLPSRRRCTGNGTLAARPAKPGNIHTIAC